MASAIGLHELHAQSHGRFRLVAADRRREKDAGQSKERLRRRTQQGRIGKDGYRSLTARPQAVEGELNRMDEFAKDIAKMDQAGAFLGDCLPKLWRRLYLGCIGEGFTEWQAIELVKAYLVAVSKA